MATRIDLYQRLLNLLDLTEQCLNKEQPAELQHHLEEIMRIHRQLDSSSACRSDLAEDCAESRQLRTCLRLLLQKTERLKIKASTKRAAIADELKSLSCAMRAAPTYRATSGEKRNTLSITL